MLSDREHGELLERQARVFGVLDVITKPVQWLIGGAKVVFLLLVAAVVCIGVPIYGYLHGGSFNLVQFALGCWILGFVVMFFGAPWYTLFTGAAIFCSLFWWDINKDAASQSMFITVVWMYEGVGLLLVAAKLFRLFRKQRANSRKYEI
jgi:hypothetical protein